jgi:hypothetical protein
MLAIREWTLIPKMDPLRSMSQGIQRFVQNPYLTDVLLRYAIYNGSDPSPRNLELYRARRNGSWWVWWVE